MIPEVSVITAAYNARATIEAALASVARQTLREYEHIVVDDGSSDGTADVLRLASGRDARVRILTTRNRGSAAARNAAIQAARGRYVAVLDADDTAAAERLAFQTEFLAANPEIDVLGAAAEFVNGQGETVATSTPDVEHQTIVRNIYRRCPFVHSTVMARRDFFQRHGGYDEALRRCQDYDLWLRGHSTSVYHNLEMVAGRYRLRSRPLPVSDLYVAAVLLRATWRDRRFLRNWHMAFRPMAATALGRMGLFERH